MSFSPEIVAAVLHHMNDDHRDDALVIVRAFVDESAESAEMIGLDGERSQWRYSIGQQQHEASVPWSETITERPQIRKEVVLLYREGCRRLGIEPHQHEERPQESSGASRG